MRFFETTEGFALESSARTRDYPEVGVRDEQTTWFILSIEVKRADEEDAKREWYAGYSALDKCYLTDHRINNSYKANTEHSFDALLDMMWSSNFNLPEGTSVNPATAQIIQVDAFTRIIKTPLKTRIKELLQ